ncbi:MAG: helix-turn-helix domain-containing protein [Clostridia bacterium]|nr:helix-turn-helix domain-containing protein [Clostridia bacterium]
MNNIKELRKRARMSQLELAELCGVHQTAVSQWEQGRTNPDTDMLVALTQIFHTSISTILGLDLPDDPAMIPVKGFVQAGTMTFIEDEDVCEFAAISPELARRGDYCGLRVRGSSMYPMFQDGDIVIVRLQNTAEDNDIVVALEGGESATLKRLKIQKNGILLMAENPEYESLFYTAEQVQKLPVTFFGKAVEIRREIK